MAEQFDIHINIANKMYPITVDRSSEEIYRKAAKIIQQRLDTYISAFHAEDKQDYYAMVMLDLAVDLVSDKDIEDRLQHLVNKLDKTLEL
ncbi:MAG: cell division protein ZapA [Bacteroidaceae bacterium]|nr:cell division protein ZapA [Bacteroidaceae bacterium]